MESPTLQKRSTSAQGSVIWEGFQRRESFLEAPYNPCSSTTSRRRDDLVRLATMVKNLAGKSCHLHSIKCLWTHINRNPWPQLQLTPILPCLPETGGRGDPKPPKVHGIWQSTDSMGRGVNATRDQKTERSLLCQGLFHEHRLGLVSRGSRRPGSLEGSGCKAGHQCR